MKHNRRSSVSAKKARLTVFHREVYNAKKAIEAMNPIFPDIDVRTFAADKEAEA